MKKIRIFLYLAVPCGEWQRGVIPFRVRLTGMEGPHLR